MLYLSKFFHCSRHVPSLLWLRSTQASFKSLPPIQVEVLLRSLLASFLFIYLYTSLPSSLLLSRYGFLVEKPVLNLQFHETNCCPKA
jgi:hypothetical protein